MITACGELTTVLPSGGRTYYRVNAMVNRIPLDEYSIIKQGDEIRPYFINSVANDPDILGLTVFIQTPSGVTVSPKVQYTLKPEENKVEDTLSPVPEPVVLPEDNPEINAPEGMDPQIPAAETQTPGTETPEETSPPPPVAEAPSPDPAPVLPEPAAAPETPVPEEPAPVPQVTEPEPAVVPAEAPEDVPAEPSEPELPAGEEPAGDVPEEEAPQMEGTLLAEGAPEETPVVAEEAV
ncbi:MAG: hypothetical protein LBP42_02865, partial [Treponema sp.]|nr:hypothetical protein [Treponema sp.]